MRNLFQLGIFNLHSGAPSCWKIECDALTAEDWAALAYMAHMVVGPFRRVIGIPRGGVPLASALHRYVTEHDDYPTLVVDDVLTTGASMRDVMAPLTNVVGLVVFARNAPPPDMLVHVLFQACSRL